MLYAILNTSLVILMVKMTMTLTNPSTVLESSHLRWPKSTRTATTFSGKTKSMYGQQRQLKSNLTEPTDR
ncbi:hypothetical protein BDF19DRAFT_455758 [Syncephalis fuscata]|nr:hypothetical protein BDF19DRAFT_455758 [Syncephalis fuscata]